MSEVIVVMNKKGGTGKTTTVISLAAGLYHTGRKVLVLDIDPQGHMSKFAKADCGSSNTIKQLIEKKASFADTVQRFEHGDILPADSGLQDYLNLPETPLKPRTIAGIIKSVRDDYDYILIDCPPAINLLTYSALVAADKVIIPTEAEYFAVDGVTQLAAQTIRDIKERYNSALKVEGFLLVKYQARRKETQDMESALELIAREFFNTKIFAAKIRDTVTFPMSQRAKKSVFEYAPKSNAAEDYFSLVKELIA